MNLILSHTGSYPRIGDSPDLQLLRRTIAALDRGERSADDLDSAQKEMTRRAMEEQARAGVELLTDGQIRWNDPVSYLAGKLEGVQIKGLLRFFDTNSYFRQPVLSARPRRQGDLLVGDYIFARGVLESFPSGAASAQKTVKPVLTGPYTLAKLSLSENHAMGSLETRALAYAEALAAEFAALAGAGAGMIQVDEPAILKHPSDWPIFARGIELLVRAKQQAAERGQRAQLALYVYFHDCVPHYEKLVALPVDVLGLDFSYNPKLVELVAAAGSPVSLGLGLIDGRNTMLENERVVAGQIERMLPKIRGERAYLGPSCGLEYLPRDRAYAKLASLGKIRAAVGGAKVASST